MKSRFAAFPPAVLIAAMVLFSPVPSASRNGAVSQIRMDLRELGYPPIDVIPAEESAIRALTVGPDGRLYGVASGGRSHLFTLDPSNGMVEPLGFLPQPGVVHRSIVVDGSGIVYIGTSTGVDNGAAGYETYEGGRLLRYDPSGDSDRDRIRINEPCPLSDLGIVAKNQGIYTLAIDRHRNSIFGLTYPDGYMFVYDIASSKTTVLGQVAEKHIPGERFEREKNIGRALVVASRGDVFTSGEGGYVYRYSPEKRVLEKTSARLPGQPGREIYNRVDAWAPEADSVFYGGTSDGYLFRFDPARARAENIGKPLNQYRLRGLVWARNGKLYGVGGDKDEMARLFSYDPVKAVYEVLGFIDVDRRPFYSWRAFLVDSMAVGHDGTIYLGQAERKSRLFVYYPE